MDRYGISKHHYGHWKAMEIMEYVKKASRQKSLNSETRTFEISSRKYKLAILGVYRHPNRSNTDSF